MSIALTFLFYVFFERLSIVMKKFVYFYIDLMKSIFYKDVVKIQIYNHSKF